jgi:hypothetical protein
MSVKVTASSAARARFIRTDSSSSSSPRSKSPMSPYAGSAAVAFYSGRAASARSGIDTGSGRSYNNTGRSNLSNTSNKAVTTSRSDPPILKKADSATGSKTKSHTTKSTEEILKSPSKTHSITSKIDVLANIKDPVISVITSKSIIHEISVSRPESPLTATISPSGDSLKSLKALQYGQKNSTALSQNNQTIKEPIIRPLTPKFPPDNPFSLDHADTIIKPASALEETISPYSSHTDQGNRFQLAADNLFVESSNTKAVTSNDSADFQNSSFDMLMNPPASSSDVTLVPPTSVERSKTLNNESSSPTRPGRNDGASNVLSKIKSFEQMKTFAQLGIGQESDKSSDNVASNRPKSIKSLVAQFDVSPFGTDHELSNSRIKSARTLKEMIEAENLAAEYPPSLLTGRSSFTSPPASSRIYSVRTTGQDNNISVNDEAIVQELIIKIKEANNRIEYLENKLKAASIPIPVSVVSATKTLIRPPSFVKDFSERHRTPKQNIELSLSDIPLTLSGDEEKICTELQLAIDKANQRIQYLEEKISHAGLTPVSSYQQSRLSGSFHQQSGSNRIQRGGTLKFSEFVSSTPKKQNIRSEEEISNEIATEQLMKQINKAKIRILYLENKLRKANLETH